MIYVDNPQLETWQPDFSSASLASPTWTRLRIGEWLLSNSLESLDCSSSPVQTIVCDSCGTVGCENGGYVHVSRTSRFVVWTAPQLDDGDPLDHDRLSALYAIRQQGLVLIPRNVWDQWAKPRPSMLSSSALPLLTGRALSDAWRLCMPRANRSGSLLGIPDFVRSQAIACDSLEVSEVVAVLKGLTERLMAEHESEVTGDFVMAPAAVERVYFDEPVGDEWSAFLIDGNGTHLAFSDERVFRARAV